MCVVTGRLDNKDLGTVQNIKKKFLVSYCQVVIILIMQELTRPTAVIQRVLLILMASCLLVFCFIISISKFKSGFHPVVYFSFGISGLFIIVLTNTLWEATPV
jgi:hypothetical protein